MYVSFIEYNYVNISMYTLAEVLTKYDRVPFVFLHRL